MVEIESESRFIWRQIRFLITLPVLFIEILIGKKEWKELSRPFREIIHFLFEPKITVLLIAANIVIFILEIFYFSKEQMINLLFKPSDIFTFNYIPVISSWFLHASVAHLVGNMIFLYIFGRVVEKDFGWKIIPIYFGSAIVSDIFSALMGEGGIGASGAIAGLIGTAILLHPFYLTYLIIGIPLPIIIVGWFAIISDITGILMPQRDNIGHFAHLGGYFAISLLVFFFNKEHKEKAKKGLIINIIFVLLMLFYWFYLR